MLLVNTIICIHVYPCVATTSPFLPSPPLPSNHQSEYSVSELRQPKCVVVDVQKKRKVGRVVTPLLPFPPLTPLPSPPNLLLRVC